MDGWDGCRNWNIFNVASFNCFFPDHITQLSYELLGRIQSAQSWLNLGQKNVQTKIIQMFLLFRLTKTVSFITVWVPFFSSSSGSLFSAVERQDGDIERGPAVYCSAWSGKQQRASWRCHSKRTWTSTRIWMKMRSLTVCRWMSSNSWRRPWRRWTQRSELGDNWRRGPLLISHLLYFNPHIY